MVDQTPLEIAMLENDRLREENESLKAQIDKMVGKYEMIVDLYLKTDRLFKELATELHNREEAEKVALIRS